LAALASSIPRANAVNVLIDEPDAAGELPLRVAVPSNQVVVADALGLVYEGLLSADQRKRSGSHFTPRSAAELLAELAIPEPVIPLRPGAILDPSCGGGAFLLAAARRLRRLGAAPADIAAALVGVDIDPGAGDAARAALALEFASWGHVPEGPIRVEVRDFLGNGPTGEAWSASHDAPSVILGNPPFLTPLRSRTRSAGGDAARAKAGAYTDSAMLFLARSAEVLEEGGRVALVLPRSVASARDALEIREAVDAQCRVESVWIDTDRSFAAAVNVWAPVFRKRAGRTPASGDRVSSIPILLGSGAEPAVTADSVDRRPGRWGWYFARSERLPVWNAGPGVARLGQFVTATAGFRDEFYACASATVEEADKGRSAGPDSEGGLEVDRWPRVITSGLIDPARIRWGSRPARINRRQYVRPVLDRSLLAQQPADSGGRITRWVEARLRPKCLLAVQSNVLEAAPDPDGRCVPITPVITVESESIGPFAVLAALLSPAATLWAHEHSAGSGLAPGTIRLPARLVGDLPVPVDTGVWEDCARLLQAGWDRSGGYEGRGIETSTLLDVSRRMGAALEVSEDGIEWFEQRLTVAVERSTSRNSV
jgi:tRNA1(Val) A37 N6-methylase TrmN6